MSLTLLGELICHQSWADAELLRAIAAATDTPAPSDPYLLNTLHHIVSVQRFFHALLTGMPFDVEKEWQPSENLDALQQLYQSSRAAQVSFVDSLSAETLDRVVDNPWMPGLQATVAQVLMQVALHSQNHRGQCLTRLRELGGTPPTLDYIIWLKLGMPAAR